MRFSNTSRAGILIAALCLYAQAQDTPSKEVEVKEVKGLPPRAAPADYQAQAQAGAVTIAAEFKGHSAPTPQGTFTTEDFVVVEAAFFGAPEAPAKLSNDDFSLRINGHKTALPGQPSTLASKSPHHPECDPPAPAHATSQTTSPRS